MSPAKPSKAKKSDSKTQGPLELVDELAQLLERYGLTELSYDTKDVTVTLSRGGGPVGYAAAPVAAAPAAPAAAAKKAESVQSGHLVTSPFVGTFYRSPSPDADPYVEVGSKVEKGQVICIIEAMKLMNEIEADVSGKVVEILCENNAAVEYGQSLFRIEPA
jgi:acetyl-CoA carboxylase biotin carboxyl carrier protein